MLRRLLFALALFGLSAPAAAQDRRTAPVHVVNVGTSFNPAYLRISPGSHVIFSRESGTHNIVQVDSADSCTPVLQPVFKSDILGDASDGASESFEFKFMNKGVYYYASLIGNDCEDGMGGSVEVVDNVDGWLPEGYKEVAPWPKGALP